MSVYTFLEVDVNRQIEEMKSFLTDIGAKQFEDINPKSLKEELATIIQNCHQCFSESSPDDIEKFLNSIVSVLIVVPAEAEAENLVVTFCNQLSKSYAEELGPVFLRVLNLLFQALPENLGVRYHVYYSMIKIASDIGMVDSIFQDVEKLRKMFALALPPPTTAQMQNLLRLLYQALLTNKMSEQASSVMLELLGTYTKENASQAREDAQRCIKASLSDPSTYIMDHLLKLKPVKFLEGEPLHDLLVIFATQKLPAYLTFYNKHKDFISSIGLDHEANIEKMRLLTFIQMAESMSEISFSLLVEELQISIGEVESFIIYAIKTGLVSARIDQSEEKVVVSSAVLRNFGDSQWLRLKEILVEWKSNLSLVEESMQNILSIPMSQPI